MSPRAVKLIGISLLATPDPDFAQLSNGIPLGVVLRIHAMSLLLRSDISDEGTPANFAYPSKLPNSSRIQLIVPSIAEDGAERIMGGKLSSMAARSGCSAPNHSSVLSMAC